MGFRRGEGLEWQCRQAKGLLIDRKRIHLAVLRLWEGKRQFVSDHYHMTSSV